MKSIRVKLNASAIFPSLFTLSVSLFSFALVSLNGCGSDAAPEPKPAPLTASEEIQENYGNRTLQNLFGGRTVAAVEPGELDDKTKNVLRERGEYLVKGAAACGVCHGADPEKTDSPLSGGRQFQDRFGAVYAANITPSVEDGIGSWTISDITRAIRSSLDNAGRPLSLDLHSTYRWLSDADSKAIAVYLLSLKPVDAPVERRRLGTFDKKKWGIFPRYRDVEGYVTAPPRAASGPYGRYLTYHVSGCYSCHTSEGGVVEEAPPFSGGTKSRPGIVGSFKALFSLLIPKSEEEQNKENEKSLGLLSPEAQQQYLGRQVGTPETVSPQDLTPDEAGIGVNRKYDDAFEHGQLPVMGPDIRGTAESGLISWSKEDIVRYLDSGKTPKGELRDGRVCPWPHFRRMSDADKQAIAMFLKQQ